MSAGHLDEVHTRRRCIGTTKRKCSSRLHQLTSSKFMTSWRGLQCMLIPEYTRVQGQRQSQSTATKDGATGHQRKEIVCMYKNSFTAQAGLTNDTIPLAQKLDKLLKILDPLDCSWKHQETSSTRQSDTCLWFPATDAYRSWREGKDTFLWLQGKGVSFDGSNGSVTDTNITTAGAGKSVLACVHVIYY